MCQLNERSINNLIGVHPDMVRLMHEAIKDSPIPFTITEGARTIKRQQNLYAQGRTTPGIIITNCDGITNKSNHQVKSDGYGHAVDLYADSNANGKLDQEELNDVPSLKIVAEHIKSVARQMGISIAWGGDWEMKDYPHYQLA